MKNSYFLSQPHQPFFVLAFINAVIFMLLFMLSYKGVLPFTVDVVNFHAFGLIYLFFTPAFFAFLFTTFPRFLSTPVVLKSLYIKIFILYIISSVLFVLGAIFSPTVYQIGMIVAGLGFLYAYKTLFDIYKKSTVVNKHDTFWILVGASFGIVGITSFIVTPFSTFSIQVSVYLYLFVLAFSVAQRMIPFFSQCRFDKEKNFVKYVVILLGLHVLFELIYPNSSFIVDIILALYVAKELKRWQLPFPNKNAMLSILHIALFWIPLAFLLSSLSNAMELFFDKSFLALDIHSLMLGFLLSVLIGFGTRVTLGHSGNMMFATKLTKFIFIWTQIVVLVRVLVSVVASFGMNYMVLFDISVTFWLVLFIIWSWQFLRVLTHGKKLN